MEQQKNQELLILQQEREEFELERQEFENERQEINRRLLEMATVLEEERNSIQAEKQLLEEKLRAMETEINERVRRKVLEQVEKSADYEENLIKEIQSVSQKLDFTEREKREREKKSKTERQKDRKRASLTHLEKWMNNLTLHKLLAHLRLYSHLLDLNNNREE